MFTWLRKKVQLRPSAGRVVEVLVNEGDSEKIIHWVVGEDIDQETYERLKDEQGKLHVVTFYRRGEKEAHVMTREHYDKAREVAANVSGLEPPALRELAEQGNVDAHRLLAGIHAGKDTTEDDAEAAKWYRFAAENGNAASQMMLAIMYLGG